MRDRADVKRITLRHTMAGWIAAAVGMLVLVAAASRAAQDKPTGATESCVSGACHAGLVTRRVVHAPTAQQKCMACHAYDEPREHRFKLAVPAPDLCTTCHVFTQRTYVHDPVRQGDCTGCHDPHGSEHRMMLIADPVRGLCQTCHTEFDETAFAFVHGPVAAGACILCHDAHSSWQPKLLIERPLQLCLDCHEEVAAEPEADRYRHQPVKEDCLACHDAHGSNIRHQLREDAPGLCYSCHEETRDSIATAPVVHGATTQEGGCLACHSAHDAPFPALQRAEQPELCLSCHDRPLTAADGRRLTDMAALLRENPEHHGPIREGACSACHPSHTAEHPKLLRKAYPPEFYAPFEPERYALCFECHISELVTDRKGAGLTRFRDGDLNLHWLHVNREKGRTCRACHEVHTSRNPFHMADSVPFGRNDWGLEIRFRKTPTGGSCLPGCHVERSYEHGVMPDTGGER